MDIIDRLITTIKPVQNDKWHYNLNTIEFNKDFFHDIKQTELKTITYIDGGNQEILSSNAFSLHFIRIVAIQNSKLIEKQEFYSFTYIDKNYKTVIYPIKTDFNIEHEISPYFESQRRMNIGNVGNIIRRLAELHIAKKYKIACLDGSLEPTYNETIPDNCIALSKTNSYITEQGKSLFPSIQQLTDKDEYDYFPLAEYDEKYPANIHIVKLNKTSNHIFKLDISPKIKDVIYTLKQNSKDLIFPGYPYDLVLADRFARVTNKEKSYLLIKFQQQLGEHWKNIKQHLNTSNSHEILDNIF